MTDEPGLSHVAPDGSPRMLAAGLAPRV